MSPERLEEIRFAVADGPCTHREALEAVRDLLAALDEARAERDRLANILELREEEMGEARRDAESARKMYKRIAVKRESARAVATRPRKVKAPCPVCGAVGHRTAPHLKLMDATCSVCGWFYTSRPEVLERRKARDDGRGGRR